MNYIDPSRFAPVISPYTHNNFRFNPGLLESYPYMQNPPLQVPSMPHGESVFDSSLQKQMLEMSTSVTEECPKCSRKGLIGQFITDPQNKQVNPILVGLFLIFV